jgi:hypothetical protein
VNGKRKGQIERTSEETNAGPMDLARDPAIVVIPFNAPSADFEGVTVLI